MAESRKGKWLIDFNTREPVIGPIAIDENGLLAIHPVMVKKAERRVIHENGKVCLLEDLVNGYGNGTQENRENRQNKRRQRIEWSNRAEEEQLALAICAAAAEHHGEISVFLNEIQEETVKAMKTLLQSILERETNINWSAFLYKTRKMPERHLKSRRKTRRPIR